MKKSKLYTKKEVADLVADARDLGYQEGYEVAKQQAKRTLKEVLTVWVDKTGVLHKETSLRN